MDYKNILTEEAAAQFRKESATVIVMTLANEGKTIRTIYINLINSDQVFCIAGCTPEGTQAMKEHFIGVLINNKTWYPFRRLEARRTIASTIEAKMKDIAEYIEVPIIHLEYAFFKEEEIKHE